MSKVKNQSSCKSQCGSCKSNSKSQIKARNNNSKCNETDCN